MLLGLCSLLVIAAGQWLTVPSVSPKLEGAKWIWVQPKGEIPPSVTNGAKGTFRFSKTVNLTGLKGGRARFTADNRVRVLIDGVAIGSADDWSQLASVELKTDHVNEITLEATNDAGAGLAENPGGVIALFDFTDASGKQIHFATDKNWSCDKGTSVELGPPKTGAWNIQAQDGPCPIFQKNFHLDEVPKSVPIKVIGLGHFQLYVNGKRVGKTEIHQPWSQYDKTIYESAFDIAGLLRRGENAIGVMLGNGFYRVTAPPDGMWCKGDAMPDFSAGQPYLLRVSGAAGAVDLGTDQSWRFIEGPMRNSHIYAGEQYDARLMPAGFSTFNCDLSAWQVPILAKAPLATIRPIEFPHLTAHEVFRPAAIYRAKDGSWSYDFGQNCSGILRFKVRGAKGSTVEMWLSEVMDETKTVRQLNLWNSRSVTRYTLRGGTSESYENLFYYHGGQFVGMTGAVPKDQPNPKNLPVIESLELVHTRLDNPPASSFKSSNQLYNQTVALIDWAMRSNMSFVMSDCPHREKLGWLECAHLLAKSFAYRYNCREWFHKICQDLRDAQRPDGRVFTVAPAYLQRPDDDMYQWCIEWGAASVLLPWQAYEWYGDPTFLIDNYDMMRAFVDHIATLSPDGIAPGALGDWYDYGHGESPGPSRYTDTQLTATALYAQCIEALTRTAEIIRNPSDQKKYAVLHSKVASAFNSRYYSTKTHNYMNNGSVQCANAVALATNLVPERDRAFVLENIVTELNERNFQQTPGDVGHLYFVRALAPEHSDVLHKVYSRKGTGSYGGILAKGLTSLPETWDAITIGSNSLNHCMLGHAMEWFYGYVLGIRQKENSVGWKQIIIDPNPGKGQAVDGWLQTPVGKIEVKAKQTDTSLSVKYKLPSGVKAMVYGEVCQGAGTITRP